MPARPGPARPAHHSVKVPPEGRRVQLRQAAAIGQALQEHIVHRNLALKLLANCSKRAISKLGFSKTAERGLLCVGRNTQ